MLKLTLWNDEEIHVEEDRIATIKKYRNFATSPIEAVTYQSTIEVDIGERVAYDVKETVEEILKAKKLSKVVKVFEKPADKS